MAGGKKVQKPTMTPVEYFNASKYSDGFKETDRTVRVNNLPKSATPADVRAMLSYYRFSIIKVTMPTVKPEKKAKKDAAKTKKAAKPEYKGVAFVKFATPSTCKAVLGKKFQFQGKDVAVVAATVKKSHTNQMLRHVKVSEEKISKLEEEYSTVAKKIRTKKMAKICKNLQVLHKKRGVKPTDKKKRDSLKSKPRYVDSLRNLEKKIKSSGVALWKKSTERKTMTGMRSLSAQARMSRN